MFSCLRFPLCWLHSQPGSSSEGLAPPPPPHGPPRTSSLLSESISFLMMSEKASGLPPVGPHWSRAQPKLVWWLGTPGLGGGGVCITERGVLAQGRPGCSYRRWEWVVDRLKRTGYPTSGFGKHPLNFVHESCRLWSPTAGVLLCTCCVMWGKP